NEHTAALPCLYPDLTAADLALHKLGSSGRNPGGDALKAAPQGPVSIHRRDLMMRTTLIAVLFASTLPAVALAMPDAGHRHHGKHAPHMFEQLDLSKDQHREMRKLMGERMKNRHEITQRYLDKLPEAERQAMAKDLA